MVNTRYSYILKSSYMSKYAYLLHCIGVRKRGEGRGERKGVSSPIILALNAPILRRPFSIIYM